MNTHDEPSGEDHRSDERQSSEQTRVLTRSVQWLVFGFTGTVVLLIAAAVVGLDKGEVVQNLGRHNFARGLITYLFTLTTILIAILLIVAAIVHPGRFEGFNRGKEVLALMLGVFGTIVGFYFGAEKSTTAPLQYTVSDLLLSESTAMSGDSITVVARVENSAGPLTYGIAFDDSPIDYDGAVPDDGWIQRELTLPDVQTMTMATITLSVRDTESTTEKTAEIVIRPRGEP